jgi:hypothetical protein
LATGINSINLKTFDLVAKSVLPAFITRSKVLKALFYIIKTFNLVFKVVGNDFGTRSKVLIMVFLAFKTFVV